jgi:hypothetical protein
MIRLLVACAAVWGATVFALSAQLRLTPSQMRSHPAIAYDGRANDPVAHLDGRIQRGEVRLQKEPVRGYLRSVLAALDVPESSQVLVFSKTSFQASRISPSNPRAIFFNDSVSVGWVRGGDVLEFTAQDPRQGTIFYTLDQTTDPPRISRNHVSCVLCHTSDATLNVPGLFVSSVYPESSGMPAPAPAYTPDHRSPFDLRWGGWYVTGSHRGSRHLGNAVVKDPTDVEAMVTPSTVHTTDVTDRFEASGYVSSHSDLVALLVLEHQARMVNLITRLGWDARLGKDAERPLHESAKELVDYLLFVDEAPLPGPIAGTTSFATDFASRGLRDRRGRSLRDLALTDRLMMYRCSFLIYSEAFDAMPTAAKALVYARMWEILSGTDTSPEYVKLGQAEREAIVEILRATKGDLPDYFSAEHDASNGP